MTDYREVWHEDNFKFSSDVRRLNHVSWDNYKKEKRARNNFKPIEYYIEKYDIILGGLFTLGVLCITIFLLN